jgi:hypothetical protein
MPRARALRSPGIWQPVESWRHRRHGSTEMTVLGYQSDQARTPGRRLLSAQQCMAHRIRAAGTISAMSSDDCLFCGIVHGELPSYQVYEDDMHIILLDAHPVNPAMSWWSHEHMSRVSTIWMRSRVLPGAQDRALASMSPCLPCLRDSKSVDTRIIGYSRSRAIHNLPVRRGCDDHGTRRGDAE